MPFNTFSVATAVTPSVIETYFSHYLNRGPLKQKPSAHISYHEGLRLIRQFLDYSSKHSVEDLQAFTAQWVPAPHWVRTVDIEVAPQFLERGARLIQDQLGRRDVERIGGATWWSWRRPEAPLKAEWIEMKKDFTERNRTGAKCDRVILYVHGGAYYFGSVDEHRYQMQRHARKLKARVLAPRYRLAPQYPFPCGLLDCIATYLYLLEHFPPSQILIAGDSAGGGMVLSMLCVLRDQGRPLPAGTILLSPWVDLTHSFPSVAGSGEGDYIPPHGFQHKPSMAWPPPPNDETTKMKKTFEQPSSDAIELPATVESGMPNTIPRDTTSNFENVLPRAGENLRINLNGKMLELRDQIQMYCTNDMLAHPLISSVMQPTLGGLLPMLIQIGGAELLHDEQLYLAHKAANPSQYQPSEAVMNQYDPRREMVGRYPPTDVQVQVWEDLCHVPHTLSFTRPAKYMYRAVAQFGAWALAHAQNRGVEIRGDDDAISIISSGPEDADENSAVVNGAARGVEKPTNGAATENTDGTPLGSVGKAGDALPPFRDHMVRQRVTRHGIIYPLAVPSELACLHLDPASIGRIKAGPVRKWLAVRKSNEIKFASERKKVAKKRAKEMSSGYDVVAGESPPATALVGRLRKGVAPEEKKKTKSWGLAMWSGWGGAHDESTLEREEKYEHDDAKGASMETVKPDPANAPPSSGFLPGGSGSMRKQRRVSGASYLSNPWSQRDKERPRSPFRHVTDTGQAGQQQLGGLGGGNGPIQMPYSRRSSASYSTSTLASRPVSMAIPASTVPTAMEVAPNSVLVPGSTRTYLDPRSGRPHDGTQAFPFRLRGPLQPSASTATLDSQVSSTTRSGRSEMGTMRSELPAEPAAVEMPTPADEVKRAHEMAATSTPRTSTFAASDGRVSPVDGGTPVDDQRAVFDNRVSTIGAIGADGMPTAPWVARANTDDLPPSSAGSNGAGTAKPFEDEIVSPVDGASKSTPFRLRNPVFDSRAASPLHTASPVDTASDLTSETDEALKAAPFKLRHPVYNGSAGPPQQHSPDPGHTLPANGEPKNMASFSDLRGAVNGTPSPTAARSTSDLRAAASRAMTPLEAPSRESLPPNTNIIMPTAVARRQIARQDPSPPPALPPKASARQASTDHKGGITAPPKSKYSSDVPPSVAGLAFEEEQRAGSNMGAEGRRAEVERSQRGQADAVGVVL